MTKRKRTGIIPPDKKHHIIGSVGAHSISTHNRHLKFANPMPQVLQPQPKPENPKYFPVRLFDKSSFEKIKKKSVEYYNHMMIAIDRWERLLKFSDEMVIKIRNEYEQKFNLSLPGLEFWLKQPRYWNGIQLTEVSYYNNLLDGAIAICVPLFTDEPTKSHVYGFKLTINEWNLKFVGNSTAPSNPAMIFAHELGHALGACGSAFGISNSRVIVSNDFDPPLHALIRESSPFTHSAYRQYLSTTATTDRNNSDKPINQKIVAINQYVPLTDDNGHWIGTVNTHEFPKPSFDIDVKMYPVYNELMTPNYRPTIEANYGYYISQMTIAFLLEIIDNEGTNLYVELYQNASEVSSSLKKPDGSVILLPSGTRTMNAQTDDEIISSFEKIMADPSTKTFKFCKCVHDQDSHG